MDAEFLKTVIDKHQKWLNDEPDGERADLRGANLSGADLDYSCLPLWCGSKHIKVDARIATQIAAHFCVLDCDDPGYIKAREAILEFAKTSHRAQDLGLLEN